MDNKFKKVITIETENEEQQLGYYHYIVGQIEWTRSYKDRLVEVDISEPCVVKICYYKGCRWVPPITF